MFKAWITTVSDGKITNDITCDWNDRISAEKSLLSALDEACSALDLSRPLVLKKHINEINQFHRTRFLPEHFMESVEFDKMELEVFETGKKPKFNKNYI